MNALFKGNTLTRPLPNRNIGLLIFSHGPAGVPWITVLLCTEAVLELKGTK